MPDGNNRNLSSRHSNGGDETCRFSDRAQTRPPNLDTPGTQNVDGSPYSTDTGLITYRRYDYKIGSRQTQQRQAAAKSSPVPSVAHVFD